MPLFKHQKDAVDFIFKNGGIGALYHEIGCGKTRTAIAAFERLREMNPDLKMIVVCPLSLIESAWGADIRKFSKLKYINLREDIEVTAGFDILICNYEFLISSKRQSMILNLLGRYRWLCVVDESSKMKNNTTVITKTLLKLRNKFQYRIVMSGTPAPNSEMEYWGQMTFLKDRIFHPNFYAFRNIYFHMERRGQMIPGQVVSRLDRYEMFKKGWKYGLSDTNRKNLIARISPHCHFAKKKDCLDLPDQIDQLRVVVMGPEQARAYMKMKRDAVTEIVDEYRRVSYIVARIALSKIIKLRQITSGFAIDEHGHVSGLKENPKLVELQDILDEAGDSQIIIWCNFHREIRDITNILGDRCCLLYGEMSTEDREKSILDFQEGRKQYLVANPASAGHGLTFVNCSLQIFYSLDFSYEKYEQARGRIHRIGQKNNCVYIHLLCKDSIDVKILEVLQKKKNINQFIEDFLRDNEGIGVNAGDFKEDTT